MFVKLVKNKSLALEKAHATFRAVSQRWTDLCWSFRHRDTQHHLNLWWKWWWKVNWGQGDIWWNPFQEPGHRFRIERSRKIHSNNGTVLLHREQQLHLVDNNACASDDAHTIKRDSFQSTAVLVRKLDTVRFTWESTKTTFWKVCMLLQLLQSLADREFQLHSSYSLCNYEDTWTGLWVFSRCLDASLKLS